MNGHGLIGQVADVEALLFNKALDLGELAGVVADLFGNTRAHCGGK